MTPGIRFTKSSSDDDLLALNVEILDGRSLFAIDVNVGRRQVAETLTGLERFREQIHGGLFNLRFGEFGPEYASGALDVRMHFRKRGRLFMRISAEAEFHRFEDRALASAATLYLISEPALLDRFLSAFRMLGEGSADEAVLEAVAWNPG